MEANFNRDTPYSSLTDDEKEYFLGALRMNQNDNVKNQNSYIEKNYIFLLAAYSAYITAGITIINSNQQDSGLCFYIYLGLCIALAGILLLAFGFCKICDGFYTVAGLYGTLKHEIEAGGVIPRSYNQVQSAWQVSTEKLIGRYVTLYWIPFWILATSVLCIFIGFFNKALFLYLTNTFQTILLFPHP